MLQGTGSDVGKTVLVAGLCRLARMQGLKVKPFKPQNMSNNAAVTADGGEIGRAQWLQALACGVAPSVHMNPVLLEAAVRDRVADDCAGQGGWHGEGAGLSGAEAKAACRGARQFCARFRHGADLVIVEGAGSPAEINLRAGDIANMGFATAANVPVVLVGDIDRGGVIASLVGTHAILPEADRAMICGYVINKFRGDVSLFDEGIDAIEGFTGWHCFGVVPWLKRRGKLPAEDSVALERNERQRGIGKAGDCGSGLERIANFDDLRSAAGRNHRVDVRFVRAGEAIPARAALVIFPVPNPRSVIWQRCAGTAGTGNLRAACRRRRACAGHLRRLSDVGQTVVDPLGIEGGAREATGLGLLNVETEMQPEKTVRNSKAVSALFGSALDAYEIHLGHTQGADCARPFSQVDGRAEGAVSANGKVAGTYLHGLFNADDFRRRYLASLSIETEQADYRNSVETALDELALELDRLGLAALFDQAR